MSRMNKRDYRSAAGFSLVEMMLVLGIGAVLTGMAVSQIGIAGPGLKGDGAMRVILGRMNQARQIAIQKRRYVRVVFITPTNPSAACPSSYCIQLLTEDSTTTGACDATCTSLETVFLEGNVQFGSVTGVGNTPDAFAAFAFGTAASVTNVKFTPDGRLVNQDGATVNGTVFLSILNTALSSRAVTVMGSTGRIRGYKWDGRIWNVV
jgi:prepilin-type N-terminal cleavage/methylation domain-containing protein